MAEESKSSGPPQPSESSGGKQPLMFDLGDPLLFRKLYEHAKSRQQFGQVDIRVNFGQQQLCCLAVPDGQPGVPQIPNYLYCVNNRNQQPTWNNYGANLSMYPPETIKLIVKTALRIMRVDSRGETDGPDFQEDMAETKRLLDQLAQLPGRGPNNSSPLELVGELVAASACEAGRGHTAHLNMFATFTRIKLASDETVRRTISDIFTVKPSDANSSISHATAFSGSQRIIEHFSDKGQLSPHEQRQGEKAKWIALYDKMLSRDKEFLASEDAMSEERKSSHQEESAEERLHRKVERHFEATQNSPQLTQPFIPLTSSNPPQPSPSAPASPRPLQSSSYIPFGSSSQPTSSSAGQVQRGPLKRPRDDEEQKEVKEDSQSAKRARTEDEQPNAPDIRQPMQLDLDTGVGAAINYFLRCQNLLQNYDDSQAQSLLDEYATHVQTITDCPDDKRFQVGPDNVMNKADLLKWLDVLNIQIEEAHNPSSTFKF